MNTNDQLLVPKGWKVNLIESADREGIVEITGPGVFHMEMPVNYCMFDFFKDLVAQPAAVEPVAWLAQAVGKGGEVYRNRASPTEITMRDVAFAWGQGVIDSFTIVIKPLFAHPPCDVAAGGVVPIQEAWEACGGNPGIKASKEELIFALRAMNDAEDAGVVLPERKYFDTLNIYMSERDYTVSGWNACLDEVARLNPK